MKKHIEKGSWWIGGSGESKNF